MKATKSTVRPAASSALSPATSGSVTVLSSTEIYFDPLGRGAQPSWRIIPSSLVGVPPWPVSANLGMWLDSAYRLGG
jgi:hypothetical protein